LYSLIGIEVCLQSWPWEVLISTANSVLVSAPQRRCQAGASWAIPRELKLQIPAIYLTAIDAGLSSKPDGDSRSTKSIFPAATPSQKKKGPAPKASGPLALAREDLLETRRFWSASLDARS
jgi:hypothetical protein